MTPVAMLIAAARGQRKTRGPSSVTSALPPYARRAAITAYAAAGMSREEIVRRTRLSYDAVALLVPDGVRRRGGRS